MMSFEIEVPTSPKWTWRFEHATIDSISGLGFLGSATLRTTPSDIPQRLPMMNPVTGEILTDPVTGEISREPFTATKIEEILKGDFAPADIKEFKNAVGSTKRDSLLQGTALYKSTRQITGLGLCLYG